MNWLQPIDIYCERVGPAFWAEPVNAITNAAFVVAGAAALSEARRRGRADGLTTLLCALVMSIGIGSFLFHTFANRWSMLADVLPIQIFTLAALTAYLMRMAGLALGAAVAAAIGVGALTGLLGGLISRFVGGGLNGSEQYAPPLLMMIGMSLYLMARGHGAGRGLGAAALVFMASLTFRTLDPRVCGAFPLGTHWLWHLLNALTLWLVLTTFIRHARSGA